MKPSLSIILAVALALAVIIAIGSVRSCTVAKQNINLVAGQRDAATASGHDAVQTAGNTSANEAIIADTVEAGTNDIRNAPAGNSNAAALRALCGMRSYRHSKQCVELLGPVAD